jgi:hypothetical protein
MGSRQECTRILDLEGFGVQAIRSDGNGPSTRLLIAIKRRGIYGYKCSGCRRRTWRAGARSRGADLGRLALGRASRDVGLSATACLLPRMRIRTERVEFADRKRASPGACASSLGWTAVDADVARRSAPQCQLEQSAACGASVLREWNETRPTRGRGRARRAARPRC